MCCCALNGGLGLAAINSNLYQLSLVSQHTAILNQLIYTRINIDDGVSLLES